MFDAGDATSTRARPRAVGPVDSTRAPRAEPRRRGAHLLTGAELATQVRRRRAQGDGIAYLTATSIDGRSGYEVAFARCAGASPQELDVDIGVAHLAMRVAARAAEGLHVAHVAAHGGSDDGRFTLVYEPAPDDAVPRWLAPTPFCDEAGVFFLLRALTGSDVEALYVRSVACLGTPRDELGRGLTVVAALWPQPDVRIGAAVHLDRVAPRARWERSDAYAVLAATAEPIAAHAIGSDDERWVLSLWHDTRRSPWPREAEPRGTPPSKRRGASPARAGAIAPRHFVTREHGEAGPDDVERARPTERLHERPLDTWVRRKMSAFGARHAQIVITRGDDVLVERAFTFAEEGYPIATTEAAFRLGSVSKPIAMIALASALEHRAHLLDAPLLGPAWLGLGDALVARLPPITPRHLASHRAGLRAFADFGPDQPDNPLSEDRVVEHLGRVGSVAGPGDLAAALPHADLADAFCLARCPLDGFAYANEGYILLGELVGRLATGRFDGFEEAVLRLLETTAPGIDGAAARARGLLVGRGPHEAARRGESPAHATFPTWGESRFGPAPGPVVASPYLDNGPYLGAAAGLSMPVGWAARLLLGLHRHGGDAFRFAADHLGWCRPDTEPLGFRRSFGFWRSGEGTFRERAHRVVRLHHDGRMEGGAALLVHQAPLDPGGDAPRITIALAFNQLGPLSFEREGMELLALVDECDGDGAPRARSTTGPGARADRTLPRS